MKKEKVIETNKEREEREEKEKKKLIQLLVGSPFSEFSPEERSIIGEVVLHKNEALSLFGGKQFYLVIDKDNNVQAKEYYTSQGKRFKNYPLKEKFRTTTIPDLRVGALVPVNKFVSIESDVVVNQFTKREKKFVVKAALKKEEGTYFCGKVIIRTLGE